MKSDLPRGVLFRGHDAVQRVHRMGSGGGGVSSPWLFHDTQSADHALLEVLQVAVPQELCLAQPVRELSIV